MHHLDVPDRYDLCRRKYGFKPRGPFTTRAEHLARVRAARVKYGLANSHVPTNSFARAVDDEFEAMRKVRRYAKNAHSMAEEVMPGVE